MKDKTDKKVNKTNRLNLDLNEQSRERLNKLKEMLESSSLTDVVKRALVLFEQAIEIQQNGGRLILKTKEGEERNIFIY